MFRVRVSFAGPEGAPYLATHWFNDSVGTAQQAATAAGTFWGAVDALMATNITWTTGTEVTTVLLATGKPTAVTAVTAVSGVGATAGTQVPKAAQLTVQWRTGDFVNGHEMRGRTFVPGLTVGALTTGGVWTGATLTAIQNAANALIADVNTELIVYSPTHSQQPTVVSAGIPVNASMLTSRRD